MNTQYAESLQQIAEILGAPFEPGREIVMRVKELRADLARATAEREKVHRIVAEIKDRVLSDEDFDGDAIVALAEIVVGPFSQGQSWAMSAAQKEQEDALRARVAELEQDYRESLQARAYELEQAEQRNAELESWKKSASEIMNKCEFQAVGNALGLRLGAGVAPAILPGIKALQQRIAELVAALIYLRDMPEYDQDDAHRLRDLAKRFLARAESATPAQEPCGGRCGDPDCDLDTTGVTMHTPAKHPDTVEGDLDALSKSADPFAREIAKRAAMKGGAHD